MTPADAAAETLCIMPVGADAAEAACAVTRQSITHCCVLDHANDAAILTAWLANKTPENLAAWIAASGAAAWGAYRGETMVGFALRAQATLALCFEGQQLALHAPLADLLLIARGDALYAGAILARRGAAVSAVLLLVGPDDPRTVLLAQPILLLVLAVDVFAHFRDPMDSLHIAFIATLPTPEDQPAR